MLKRISNLPDFRDAGLLIFRITFGLFMLLAHGLPKATSFSEKVNQFPDPLGIGQFGSLSLVVFAEVVCSLSVTLGFMTRIALIPLIITMAVAAFIIHGEDPFSKKELGLVYLLSYVAIFMSGPGRYSIDSKLYGR